MHLYTPECGVRLSVWRKAFAVTFVAACLLILASCGSPKIYNEDQSFSEAGTRKTSLGEPYYNSINYAETPRVPQLRPDLIIVTLSGGGIRAAALAAATLNELEKFTINGIPITNNIVLISSTSGGSITAGYIAAHGFGHYADFRRDFLSKDNTRDLLLRALRPRGFYDRSSIMQEFLEERLDMKGMTYGELATRNDRPYFVMNATNLSTGEPFSFVPYQFRELCTNMNPLPLSVAMTASGAFPFVLTDVELKNRMDECPERLKEETGGNPFRLTSEAVAMRDHYNLVHAYDEKSPLKFRSRPKYIHLSDGGLVDNLGAVGANYIEIDAASSIKQQVAPWGNPENLIRQVLIIEVNAKNEKHKDKLDQHGGSPGILSMIGLVTGIPIDRATTLNADALRASFHAADSLSPYVATGILMTEIDFDLIDDAEESLRDRVKSIGMTFTLSQQNLKDLEYVATSQLRSSPCFARYVADSGAVGPGYILPQEEGRTGFRYDCWPLMDKKGMGGKSNDKTDAR